MRPAEPTLADLMRDLWRARLFLIIGVILGSLGAFAFMAVAVPQYRAGMMVTAALPPGAPDMGALIPNNASFAVEYIAKGSGLGDSTEFMRFETIMREPSVAGKIMRDEAIGQGVASARRFYFETNDSMETPEEMAAWLQKNIAVDPVGTTRLRRISLLHPDPVFAVSFLQSLYKTTDALIRSEMIEKTEKRKIYLQTQLEKTGHPDHRRVLTELLMEQEQIAMILAAGEPFAARIAEPPYAGARPYWPRRVFVFPVFILVGLFLGYIAYGFRPAHG